MILPVAFSGPRPAEPAFTRRDSPPVEDQSLKDRELALAAHLIVLAAELGGEAEIAEVEAGEIDAIDGGDAVGRAYAVLGKGRIAGGPGSETASQSRNRGKA